MHASRPDRQTYLGLAVLSAGMLTYEINLTRLYAVQQFHHFAFLVVSLAVMGLGASGLALSLRRRAVPLGRLAGLFALSIAAAYLLANWLPFDSYAIAWDRRHVGILALYFLSAALPFFTAGMVSGASLAAAGENAHLPYAAVFVGSAAGCPLALFAHAVGGAYVGMFTALTLGLLAAASLERVTIQRAVYLFLAVVGAALIVWSPAAAAVRLSPYKPLFTTGLASDAAHDLTAWDATTRLDVIRTSSIHVFPGLSLNAEVSLPPQLPLFLDGDGPLPITDLDPSSDQAARLAAAMPSTLAYELRPQADALVLNAGPGLNAQLALAAGARSVTLPIERPIVLDLLGGRYSDESHRLLENPRIRVVERSGRAALLSDHLSFDVIEFALSDPYRPIASGAFSLTEEYSLTVEALQTAYRSLNQGGVLVVTRWLGSPPSESARAWATVLEALQKEGVPDLPRHLAAYRTMRTATLIASREPFSSRELRHVRTFLERNSYDPIFLPDLQANELNRHNRLPDPIYHNLFSRLLKEPQAAISDYSFTLRPPTDDRPYFHHFFRWRQTPEILATLGRTWQPYGGSGYLVLIALLILMMLIAIPLGVAPLFTGHRRGIQRPGATTLVYFSALGAGYLLVEIPLIQRFTLLLDRPAMALAIVLFSLLMTSGIGSLLSTRLSLKRSLSVLPLLVGGLALLLPWIIRQALPWPVEARAALAMGLMAVPGLLMGVPFAAGLRQLEQRSPGRIPWAWAVNGAASGLSGVTAATLALDFGTRAVLTLGAVAYLVAWLTSADIGATPPPADN